MQPLSSIAFITISLASKTAFANGNGSSVIGIHTRLFVIYSHDPTTLCSLLTKQKDNE